MPIYKIQAPDGNVYRIEGPEGANPEDLFRTVSEQNPMAAKTTKELQDAPSASTSISDIARSFGSGAVGATKSLVDVFGAGSGASEYLGGVSESLQKGLSPERQAEMARRAELSKRAEKEGTWAEIKNALAGVAEAPLQSIAQGVGSSIPTIAAGLATLPASAPAALSLGVARASQILIAAAQGTGEVKGNAYESIKQAYKEKGLDDAEASKLATEAQAYTLKNAPLLIGGAAFGALDALTGFEKSASKALRGALTPDSKTFTKEGLDTAIANLPKRAAEAPTYAGQALKTGIGEALPEGLQGGYGQIAQNLAMDQAGFETPTFQGVAGAAARDALVGALTGTSMSPLSHSVAKSEYEADKYLRGVQKEREFEREREEFAKQYEEQQTKTKEQLGVPTMLALPAPAPSAEEEKYTNPAATILKEQLAPEEVKFVDDYRKQNNLPKLKSYSIEDIKDAMPGIDPAGEQGRIDSILAAKYEYKPVDDQTGEVLKYTPQDVLAVAEDEKNIATGTKGFKDFLTRTTGTDDLNSMSQPQLFAAYSAFKQMPASEQQTVLPEGTGASRFTDKQYNNAVKFVGQTFEEAGNVPLSKDTIISDIKDSTGLEQDRDADALLNTAVANGDLEEKREVVYRTYDDNDKLVATYRDKAKATAAAEKQGLNVKEDTLVQLTPPAAQEPSKRTSLPEGYSMTKESVKEGEQPAGFEIYPEGRGKAVVTVPTKEEVQGKIDRLTGLRQKEAEKLLGNITRDSATIENGRKQLESMEARGQEGSQAYELAKTRQAKQEKILGQRIERNLNRIEEYKAPLKVRSTPKKVQVTREKVTVTKQGKSLGSFPNNAKAQEAIVVQMTDEELANTASDGRLGAIADRAAKEIERRKQPTGIIVKRSPKKAEQAPALSPDLVAKADEIGKKLIPMLQRFGLKDVGLKIVAAIKNGAEGSYANNLIQLAIDADNPVQTMRHESLHALKDLGFFTEQQWKTLESQAKKTWIDKYLKNQNADLDGKTMSRYDAYKKLGLSDEDIMEEAIADAFADFDAGKSPGGMIASILNRLNNFFRALKNALMRNGFETAEDIFGKAERGELRSTKAATEEEKSSLRNTKKGLLNPNILPKYEKIIDDVVTEMGLTPQEFASTSLIHQTGKAGVEQFETDKVGGLPEVIQFLQDQRRSSGLPVLNTENPEDRKMIAKLMSTEAMAAIRSGGANLEWYDSIINKTLAMAGLKYPELNTDVNARAAFKVATAITSQGLNVEDNLAFAMRVYDQFRQNGKFPEVGQGADQSAMVRNFKLANYLLEDMKPNLMRQFLETEFTVDELRSAGFNIGGELGDEKVLGSSVFGPKIGFGFYSNLNGNFDPVTMDMWFMRTIGRLTGKLKAFRQDLYDAQLGKFRNELDSVGGNGVFANQFDQNDVELAKVDDKAAEALARKVKSAHEKDYKINRAGYDDGTREKSKLVAASETMIKSLDSPKDAPANGTERRNLRDIVRQMVDIVEEKYGKRVPPASLQAVIWYPEQELYKALGVKLRVTSQNYAGAIEKILLGEGYAESDLGAAAKLGSRTAQQLAKTAVAKGSTATGAQPVRLGSLQAGEKETLLERGRKRVVLEAEKTTPKRKRVIFEVAPDPNNKALTNKWRSLSNEQRIEISDRIGNKIVKDALDKFGLTGYVDTQVGSYLDDTNPSFALYLDSGDSVAMANFLGYALSQDSMMVVSPKEGKGLTETGAVRVELGDVSADKVNQIYQKLREIEVNGEKPIGGQSFMNGHMVILNYSNVPTEDLAKLIDDKLDSDYPVIIEKVYTAFPEKKDYDYANPSSDPKGNAGVLRQSSRDLRSEATRLLQKELKGVQPKLSLRLAESLTGPSTRGNGIVLGEQQENAVSFKAIHYGKFKVDELSGSKYGTGIRGAERRRLDNAFDDRIKNRVYFYIAKDDGTLPQQEAGLGGYVYTQQFDNILGPGPEMSKLFSSVNGDSNNFESAVIDAGYDGYAVPSMGMMVVLNHNTPVNYEGTKGELMERGEKLSLRSTKQAPDTPEFKRWFGDSYFTDKDGNPLVMYHGTARDIEEFRPKQANAIFITASPAFADNFAKMSEEYIQKEAYLALTKAEKVEFFDSIAKKELERGSITPKEYKEVMASVNRKAPEYANFPPAIEEQVLIELNNLIPTKQNIMPLYVSAKNVFDYGNKEHVAQVMDYLANHMNLSKKENPDQFLNAMKGLISRGNWTKIESPEVQNAIRTLGFDGFSILEAGAKNYAVYNPTQLKSATGNIGTYDLNNPKLRYSLRSASSRFNEQELAKAAPVGYKSRYKLIEMNIDDFLSLAKFGRTESKLQEARSRLAKGENFTSIPYLYVELEGNALKVTDHEGRHRALALQEAGYTTIPVELLTDVIRWSEQTDPENYDYVANWPTRIEAQNGAFNLNFSIPMPVAREDSDKAYGSAKLSLKRSLKSNINPAISSRIDDITTAREEKGFAERMMEATSPDNFSKLRAQALNRYNRLSEYDKKLAETMGGAALLADSSAESAALMSDLSAGVTASALGVHDRHGGIPVFRNGITTVDGSVKGPIAIFKPLAEMGDPYIYQMWQFAAGAKRGTRLLADGREHVYTAADIAYAAQLEQKYPVFKQVAKEWNEYNNGLVKYMVDTGVITKEAGVEWTKYSDYVPFYRQLEDEKTIGPRIFQSISGVRAPKTLKGGTAPLADLMETVVRNTQSAIQSGMKNVAAQRAVKVAEGIQMANRLPSPRAGADVVQVLENGKPVSYEVADQLFIDAVKSLNLPDLPFIGFFAGPANLLRNLVTKDPGFMMANMVRDSMSAWVTSGVKMTPVVSAVKNFTDALRGTSPEYRALLNAGVLGGYDYAQNVEKSASQFKSELSKYGPSTTLGNIKRPFTSLWDALEKGTSASDAATRIEVYKNVMAETGNEAEAIFRSLEVMNFNRKGSSAVVRILTAAVPFLNARMQGLDVLYRAAFGKMANKDAKAIQKAFFVRGATIMALSMMYWAMTHDEDEYKKQEQETRDNYWLLPKLGVKIPIPFEVGVIFKVIPERIASLAFGTDTTEDFAKAMKRNLVSTFAFNPIPQVVLPLVEARTNYSFFTGRAIIGQGLEGVAPEFQVGSNTSSLAKWLGKTTGMSPMMIDHVIGGYTGTFGMYVADAVDAVVSSNSDVPRASKRFEQMPLIKRFALDPEARGNVTAYYELKNSVDEIVRTSNFLERTMNYKDMGEYSQETAKLLASQGYIKALDKDIKYLNDMAGQVRASGMDADQKRDTLVAIGRAQNNLTANVKDIKKLLE